MSEFEREPSIEKPKHRSRLRHKAGMAYYGMLRKMLWIKKKKHFSKTLDTTPLPYKYTDHQTILLRKLKDVDMWLQENKIINLKIAAKKLNGVIIKPGEVFSYWYLIGKPSRRKGYVDGMILNNGGFEPGVGGGLCQMSNMLFWMAIHTPLTIVERHRHAYDVFPDSNRTQPFGSGATCFYPHGDLMIYNNTEDTYQILIHVGEKNLEGEIRVSSEPQYKFEIKEENHRMVCEYWGGYTRHNEIYQLAYDIDGNFLEKNLVVKNSAVMMYSPFLSDTATKIDESDDNNLI